MNQARFCDQSTITSAPTAEDAVSCDVGYLGIVTDDVDPGDREHLHSALESDVKRICTAAPATNRLGPILELAGAAASREPL
jgi:hypothetical protein